MNVPKLRFKEFDGEWEERKLIDNAEKVLDYRGKSPTKFGMNWGNEGYLVLSALNVKDGYIDKSVDAKYGNQELLERWMGDYRLVEGDVLFTTEAPLGNVAQVPDNNGYILNQRAVAFKTSNGTDNNFFAQLLRSPRVQNILYANSSGGTAKGIGMKEFAKLTSYFPKIDEQKKIGLLFEKLDKKIQLQQQKIDLLQEQKKGYMQKIFKQQMNFDNDDIWPTRKVLEVATLLNGRAYKKDELLERGKYRVLRVGNFFTNDSWYYSNLELEDNKYANRGDLLYAWSASFGPQIWKGEKIIYHYHIWRIIPNENLITKDFLYHWFDFDKERILSKKNGSTMVHITKGGLEQTDIQVPSLKQQKQISNFLNKLDEKINLSKIYLKSLQKQKQGFMQQMFI